MRMMPMCSTGYPIRATIAIAERFQALVPLTYSYVTLNYWRYAYRFPILARHIYRQLQKTAGQY